MQSPFGITLLPYYSFVANIVKDRAEVIPIVKAESFDSHTYQPKVEDIERASKVDVVVVNGIGHDEFIYKILEAVDKNKKPVIINANKDVALMPVAGTLNDEKIMDSHTFISITAAIQQVHNITKELVKLDPKNKDFYLANSTLLNYLGRMGYSTPDDKEVFSLDEFVQSFDIKRVSLGGPVFDIEKLYWLNGEYLRSLSPDALKHKILAWAFDDDKLTAIAKAIQPRIHLLSDAVN